MGTMMENSKLLILHGWTYSTEKWKPFLDLLEEKGLKPSLLKIPGLTEKIDRVWNLDDYVNWLDKKVGNKKVVLVGHSSGGRLSLAYALKYPQKVSKLILIDSAGVYHRGLLIGIKRFVFKKIAKLGKKFTSREIFRKLLYKAAGENDYKFASPLMQGTMKKLISIDLTSRLTDIKIPTIIIWGEYDKVTPVFDGKLMHKLIPDSKFYLIKTARHSPMFTHPKQVVEKIAGEFK